jgi:hypothetical protein
MGSAAQPVVAEATAARRRPRPDQRVRQHRTRARLNRSPPASDAGATISDYVIRRSQNRTTWSTVRDGVSTARSHTVSRLHNGTRYWFRVAARNAAGLGGWSGSVTAVPHN